MSFNICPDQSRRRPTLPGTSWAALCTVVAPDHVAESAGLWPSRGWCRWAQQVPGTLPRQNVHSLHSDSHTRLLCRTQTFPGWPTPVETMQGPSHGHRGLPDGLALTPPWQPSPVMPCQSCLVDGLAEGLSFL